MVKHIIIALMTITVVNCGSGLALAHGSFELPLAGLTPSNFFYFLDRLGETLREIFAFSPEAKVKLQLSFAAERVAELELELETNGVEAKGLEIARNRLAEHIVRGNEIIHAEIVKGSDMEMISEDFDHDLKELLQRAEEGSDDLTAEIEKMEELLMIEDEGQK
ncbi:MAG: DUF5667 domain-containing protein [bacterium]|nr:DUF5667 domain-containing protein [bacterium]